MVYRQKEVRGGSLVNSSILAAVMLLLGAVARGDSSAASQSDWAAASSRQKCSCAGDGNQVRDPASSPGQFSDTCTSGDQVADSNTPVQAKRTGDQKTPGGVTHSSLSAKQQRG